MPTRKQEIYCRLLQHGILALRLVCATDIVSAPEQLPRLQQAMEIGFAHANFLHRVSISILEPEYVDNDISFINWAFPRYVDQLGEHLGAETAALMLEFHEGVPTELQPRLTWRPDDEFRLLAERRNA